MDAGSLSRQPRAVAMARRLVLSALRAGASEAAADRLEHSFHAALELRAGYCGEEGHYDFLHPARTALILLDDVGVRDAAVLAAAPLADSMRPELMPSAQHTVALVGPAAAAVLAALPLPTAVPDDEDGDARLLELLVTAEPPVCLLALAERLDQARHLHLGEHADARAFHARIRTVYLPAAERMHALLGRRYRRWVEAYARRFR